MSERELRDASDDLAAGDGGAAPLGTGINPRLMLNATIAGVPGSWAAAAS